MFGVFQYCVTASWIAPEKFGVASNSIASTWFAGSLSTAWDFWAQASMDETSTSIRTGIEPFLLLNASWLAGSRMISASLSCVAICALSLVDGNTNTSPPITIF